MPWFYCDLCGDTIKKPKINAHLNRCPSSSFTCLDCSANFDSISVQGHTSCVTEKQKYVDGATKPGGFASNGFTAPSTTQAQETQCEGIEYLSKRPPWRCNLCEIVCTSQKTLLGHAAGSAHRKKVKRATVVAEQDQKRKREVEEAESETLKLKKQKCEKLKNPDRKKHRKEQKRLGLELLTQHKNKMSIKKFLKQFQKKSKDQPHLNENILSRMKKLANIEVTDSVLYLKE